MTYLCTLDKCHQTIHNDELFKGWMSTYTLLGILRAPYHFEDFCSVKSLYEGGNTGEGIIKTLRPLSPTGIRDGWSKNLIENYYRRDVMYHLLKACEKE